MNTNPVETFVVVDTIPVTHLGVMMKERFGLQVNFLKSNADTFLQELFEYKTVSNFVNKKTEKDDGFYELAHLQILSAITEFNGYFQRKQSFLIHEKSFTPHPTLEQNKKAIRTAWLTKHIDAPSRN